jgi:Mrp family chromosome partitioning ATPase
VGLGNMTGLTAKQLGLTEAEVSQSLSITALGESNVVSVSATTASPPLSARVATTYAHLFVKQQRGLNRGYIRDALELVEKQLEELPPKQRFGAAAVTLQNRAQTLRLLEGLSFGSVRLAQVASVPSSPSSPKTFKNTVIGAMLGLLLGLGIAFVLERLRRDRLVSQPEELEDLYDLPLLGVVPDSPALARSSRRNSNGRRPATPAAIEAFNLIRARLRFFKLDHESRTVMVTAASEGEGTTTVTRHLAEAAVRAGSRTLLIEANLRSPTLAAELDLSPGPSVPEVLAGVVTIGEAIQSVDPETAPGSSATGERRLDVLYSRVIPSVNPVELIESAAMKGILANARARYDLVLLDTPPLLSVSDAFPLLGEVDGVVVVSWVGRGRRDLAERLRITLDSSAAPQLGVIANGAKAGGAVDANPPSAPHPPTIAAASTLPDAPPLDTPVSTATNDLSN